MSGAIKKCKRLGYVAHWCPMCLEPRIFEMRAARPQRKVPHDFLTCESCGLREWTNRQHWLAINRELTDSWSTLAEHCAPELLEHANELRAYREWIADRPSDDPYRREYLRRILDAGCEGFTVDNATEVAPTYVSLIQLTLMVGAAICLVWGASISASYRMDDNASLPAWACMWACIIPIGLIDWWGGKRQKISRLARLRPMLQRPFSTLRVTDGEIELLLEQASIAEAPIAGRFKVADLSVGITERPVASLDSEEEDLLWSADSAG